MPNERPLDEAVAKQHATGRTAFRLLPGGLLRDPLESTYDIGRTDRKGHNHHPVQVAARLAGFLVVERDRDHGPQGQIFDAWPSGVSYFAQARSDGGEQNLVDRAALDVGNSLDDVEPASDERQSSVQSGPACDYEVLIGGIR